jgi:hypothetical protein
MAMLNYQYIININIEINVPYYSSHIHKKIWMTTHQLCMCLGPGRHPVEATQEKNAKGRNHQAVVGWVKRSAAELSRAVAFLGIWDESINSKWWISNFDRKR